MSLIKRGDSPNWYYYFRVNGKAYTGSTKTTNRAKAAQIEQKRKNEVWEIVTRGDKEPIKVKDAISNFLADRAKLKIYKNYRACCTKLSGEVWDTHKKKKTVIPGLKVDGWLHDVTAREVQAILVDRRSRYKEATVSQEMSVLYMLIQLADEQGFRVPNNLKIPKIKVKQTRFRYLSDDEEELLLKECGKSQNKDLKDYVIFLLDTGCRSIEIKTLAWSSVDLEAQTVEIYRSKTNSSSTIPMSDRLFEMLLARYKKRKGLYVFPGKGGKGHYKNAREGFDAACDRAGINSDDLVAIKGSRVTQHTLRHTFASRMVKAGMSLQKLGLLLGHNRHETTARYGHLAPTDANDEMLKVLNARPSY